MLKSANLRVILSILVTLKMSRFHDPCWKFGYWLLVIGVVGLRFSFGGYLAITGPTLLHLSENVAKDFDTTAWVFTVYSISYIMASIITGFLFPKITRFDRKITVMGIPLVLAGCVWTWVPEVSNFYSLVGVYIITDTDSRHYTSVILYDSNRDLNRDLNRD